ncbi:tRNA pseudouridine(55) synthase TruB [Lysobacter korlensis]|uniref:tRNA pseudouridine synthase B n=1 Tax=Lysobacter korlensis TaxID=553636 RepID=A0ABV6RY49_9GAMM
MTGTRQSGGIVLVDKPAGITSHDVVSRVRRLAGTRKVGHAGTLDPAATGLLLLGLDSSTRLLTYLVGLDKEYFATIRLGIATSTDDAEGEVVSVASDEALAAVAEEGIREEIAALTGRISQVPSTVSAIKVDGKRAYARARAGETVTLVAREVTVSAFELLGIDRSAGLQLRVRVECSSGTYIRALARDLGERLGVGGSLSELRRTRIGPFAIDDAAPLDESIRDAALAPADVASRLYPVLGLSAEQTVDLSHGKRVQVGEGHPSGPLAAVTPDGALAGIVEVSDGAAKTLVNFPTAEVTG